MNRFLLRMAKGILAKLVPQMHNRAARRTHLFSSQTLAPPETGAGLPFIAPHLLPHKLHFLESEDTGRALCDPAERVFPFFNGVEAVLRMW